MGDDQRPDFSSDLVHHELMIIRNDLHCNAVRVVGQDVDRLVVAAETALDLGLVVWFSPELWDHSAEDTLNHAVRAAASGRRASSAMAGPPHSHRGLGADVVHERHPEGRGHPGADR